MQRTKVHSFTLSELLVVMIITAIVVGIAFSVLRLVQQQVRAAQSNFDKTADLALFEQTLWQDFNRCPTVKYHQVQSTLMLESEVDSVIYRFTDNYTLRNADTIRLRLMPKLFFINGRKVNEGIIDAISISAETELPEYSIFVSSSTDAVLLMNHDGI